MTTNPSAQPHPDHARSNDRDDGTHPSAVPPDSTAPLDSAASPDSAAPDRADLPVLQPAQVAQRVEQIAAAVGGAVVGLQETLRLSLAGILAGGHVLIEDNPGLGKTLLARSLAGALGLEFRRLQFTPDLLPADITGSYLYHPTSGEFQLQKGPLFCGLLLADELNRTPPKTQSALLEAMQEGQVSIEGTTHQLPDPFCVIATANQIEYEGTYPLPEAQLDRFLVRLRLGYPSGDNEHEMLRRRIDRAAGDPNVAAVTDPAGLLTLRHAVENVRVDDDVIGYCVDLARASRQHSAVEVGISPRGTQALLLLARACAVLDGRGFVLPEDIKQVAVSAWSHRLVLKLQAYADALLPENVVAGLLDSVPAPPADRSAPEVAPTSGM